MAHGHRVWKSRSHIYHWPKASTTMLKHSNTDQAWIGLVTESLFKKIMVHRLYLRD